MRGVVFTLLSPLWAIATTAGFIVLSFPVVNSRGDGSLFLLSMLILVILGPAIGLLQAVSVGIRRPRVWLWVAVCDVALSFGSVMGSGMGAALLPRSANEALRWFFMLPFFGLVFGILTAPFAEWIFRPAAVQSLPEKGTPETGGALS